MKNARILLVDDDTALLDALPEALRLRVDGIQIDTSETAVDALLAQRFTDDQISLVARGAETDESGKFVPGGLMVTVTAKGREDEAERVLKQHEAREVTTNRIGATGRVGEETT